MSEAVSALGGKSVKGFADVAEAGLVGMVTIRADLGTKALAKALKALGLPVPGQRRIESAEGRQIAWMSPDELLLICAYAEAPALVAQLSEALAKEHALVVDVSDARALFRVNGTKADQVLTKLCPVDFALLPDGEIRRTRAAQVAVALWRSDEAEISLICFRSVAGYVFDLLEVSARKGGELS
ncbi:sarcosine oxidase subunit gamma [Pseudothioclava arenosa]|uniref:Sarcosine oxidase subunit gamma n=1 Tax=Pseudothioclava arenosa TaxID=1795308 RepID=A0A2A4CSY0_9RHOB|nr:sarcosine oxidase subunit gamma family protein [Pseudothioclava arenosa]PCD77236.1 sarcosine oxidase subunit gamma [Pseudothioclava arenosa]